MVKTQQQTQSSKPTAEPRLILLASPDEYLLELKRDAFVVQWTKDHPDGEVVRLDPAPSPHLLVQELINPSLFASARLVLVSDARPYFPVIRRKRADSNEDENTASESPEEQVVENPREHLGDQVAKRLDGVSFRDTSLLLALANAQAPKGRLTELVTKMGQVQFFAVPKAPPPWKEARVSQEQRAVLHEVISHVAPAVAAHSDVVDALCESYGFHVRELVQAAARLATSGEITPEAVRAQAGVGECSLQRLEDALIARDRTAVAQLLGRLSAGGVLVDWRGNAVDAGGVGPVLTGMLNRAARLALAMRLHAQRCGLKNELDPRKCAAGYWYKSCFWDKESETGLHKSLAADAAQAADSPIAGMSPWAAHRAFRLAAAYEETELIELLGALARCGVERSPAREAVPALTPLLLALTAPRASDKRSGKR